ncbi:hypothetical protein G3570_16020 [Balneolaceae bacterium YR4-1]|uniref:Uncharacterized protein n=1 Tax=Halalkalibaculum roseum TaxID=2709311 RepID=A0A6M1SYI3_9BACT|nr:hypothetical protein [Halalkalibaculum roseum]NGP78150.1 hypothetical protein [Halalkalibaculum roseum]
MKKMYEVPGFYQNRPGKVIELCEYLTKVMNEIHGTGYSFRFWVILLEDYAWLCVNRELQMSEQIIRSRPAITPINGWELPNWKDRWRERVRQMAKAFYKGNSMNKINNILEVNKNICVGIRGKELERFGLGTYCPAYYNISSFILDTGLRKKLKSIAESEDSIFRKNVILQLPRYYVEDFKKNISKINLFEPHKKIFHAEHLSGMMDLIIALYLEHGAKYYLYQLGCNFGEKVGSPSPITYIKIDKLRTFGWKIHDKDEPHVAYRLEQFSRCYKEYKTNEHYDICIVYNQVNIANKKSYKKISELFFKKIEYKKYPDIILRPRGYTRKMNNSGQLRYLNKPERISIDRGMRPIHELVKASRVMVHLNIPSTNFLECVYVNHPVVAICNVDNPTEIVKPYYRFFKEMHVFHDNMESLVEHLNSVDLGSWWEKVTGYPMYKEFKHKFARKVKN